MSRQALAIVLAVLGGLALAALIFRARGRAMIPAGRVEPTPPGALPRYLGLYGEYYDPYGTWPYGNGSAYTYWLPTNSGVPVSQVPSPGGRGVGTAPMNQVYGNGGTRGPRG